MLLYDKIIEMLAKENLLDINPLTLIDNNNPKPDDSLSTLINKLSCSTTQMWHSQDMIYKMRFMDKDEFVKTYSGNMEEVHMCFKRGCDLNVQRAHLMDAIDQKILEIKRG